MNEHLAVDVSLSTELLAHLWAQARRIHVPVQWLVAGLVCDTFDSTVDKAAADQSARARVVS